MFFSLVHFIFVYFSISFYTRLFDCENTHTNQKKKTKKKQLTPMQFDWTRYIIQCFSLGFFMLIVLIFRWQNLTKNRIFNGKFSMESVYICTCKIILLKCSNWLALQAIMKHLTMAIIYINLNILLPIKMCVRQFQL